MADKQLSTQKMMFTDLQRWHDTNPTEELLPSQKEIARFLEFGYLALWDHPELAAEIRNTAHKSRTQHVLTADLFKKFVVTVSSVVNTYCPMMMDALKLQDKDKVVEALGHVLGLCLDMKKETEDARNSYLSIQEKVQQNLVTVAITNKKIRSEIEVIEQTKKRNQVRIKEEEKQQAELEREKDKLMDKVKAIEQNRDDWLEKAVSIGKEEEAHTVIEFAMLPTGIWIKGAFATGSNIGRKKEKADQAREAIHEANQYLKNAYEERCKLSDMVFERRQHILEKIAHVEALELQKSSFGDIKSLIEAVTQLHNVDKQFKKILLFWDSMATMLTYLHLEQKCVGVFLKKKEVEKYAERFKLSIDKAEKTWNRIGLVCQSYAEVNDKVILEVYGFLSRPVDNMTEEEVKERKASLIKEIKDEADQLDDVE